MSMFRSPNDMSSSVDDSSNNGHGSSNNRVSQGESRGLTSGDVSSIPNSRTIARSATAVHFQNLQPHQQQGLLHLALVEARCKETAWLALNSSRRIDDQLSRDDPQVEFEAQKTYTELVSSLNQTLMLPEEFIGPEGKQLRQSTFNGLDGILYNTTATRLSGIESMSNDQQTSMLQPSFGGVAQHGQLPNLQLATVGAVHASAPSLMMGHNASLFSAPSPYKDEHQELCLLGKGGYGQVWKVRNHLDNQLYAVKKIIITSQRLQKFNQNAKLDALLDELRTLAKLHHTNVVRYYHGWIEKTDSGITTIPQSSRVQQNLLEAPTTVEDITETSTNSDREIRDATLGVESLGFDAHSNPFQGTNWDERHPREQQQSDGGIVFAEDSLSQEPVFTADRNRRASRGTNSSTVTFTKASLHSVGEEEDEDVETVPRSPERQVSISQIMQSRAESPDRDAETIYHSPDITLFIKMSLHPMTLSNLLSPDQPHEEETVKLRHCFHQEPSIGLLLALLDGVEYLHSQNIVHRDLKPANIFLSVHTARPPATSGFVDVKACKQCKYPESDISPIYLTPCIGDFGLIAEMKDTLPYTGIHPVGTNTSSASSTGASSYEPSPLARLQQDERPVGTQFYRPNKMPTKEPKICPKLDVYSLGVIAFELISKFGTRTERAIKLTGLSNGKLPEDMKEHPMSEGIKAMVDEDREKRWDCGKVKEWLNKLSSAGN